MNRNRIRILTLALLIISIVTLIAQQQFGTPAQIRVLTDANNYLLVANAAQTNPISQPTQFNNARLRTDASGNLLVAMIGGVASGTVTSVSIVTANGVSGSVATATTTPAITLTLGAITPTSVTNSSLTAGRVVFSGTGGLASDDADLTFLTDTLTATKIIGSTSVTGGTTGLPPNGVEGYFATTSSSDPRGLMSAQYSTDAIGARFQLRKGRGTEASPTIITTADVLGRIRFSGYDGLNYLQMASIDAVSSGTIAATRIPTSLVFSTATNALPSILTTALTINSSQQLLGVDGISTLPTYSFASEATLGFWRSAAATVTLQGAFTSTGGGTFVGPVVVTGGGSNGTLQVPGAGFYRFSGRAATTSTSDGNIIFSNAAVSIGSQLKVDALPTVSSGFGTSPAITAGSTPLAGSINVGTGAPGTGGVINFNGTAFPSAPFVVCQDDSTLLTVRCTATTTQLTVAATALTASDIVSWIAISSK